MNLIIVGGSHGTYRQIINALIGVGITVVASVVVGFIARSLT